ncbi:uncharacterized protein [Primulina eburnea]|uniref:uncharacterized protein n=1 Tax=Primulina eburnea TaxID=1245227 RepID=UPI003C6C9EE3
MKIALSVKNKLGFIDGSVIKPSESEPNLLNAWSRNNNIVISWLLNSVSKDISSSVLFAESAMEIWNDLKERFQQSNGPRIFQLLRDLLRLRQDQDSVSVYFTKLKALWEELNHFRPMCNCGKCICSGVKNIEAYVQMDYTLTFLMGLNDSFTHVRSQVLLLDPLPPISRVFALIVQEEWQREVGACQGTSNQGMAFTLKSDRPQTQQGSRRPQQFQRGRPYCTTCNVPSHTIETCYKIHGYPPGYKNRFKQGNRVSTAPVNQVAGQANVSENQDSSTIFQNFNKGHMEQLMAMFIQQLSSSDKKVDIQDNASNPSTSGTCFSISVPSALNIPTCWIVDSGASRHICSNRDAFIFLKTIQGSRVTLPNNEYVDVHFCGDVRLGTSLILSDALCIPEFKLNLLSVSCLLERTQNVMTFRSDSFMNDWQR